MANLIDSSPEIFDHLRPEILYEGLGRSALILECVRLSKMLDAERRVVKELQKRLDVSIGA